MNLLPEFRKTNW